MNEIQKSTNTQITYDAPSITIDTSFNIDILRISDENQGEWDVVKSTYVNSTI